MNYSRQRGRGGRGSRVRQSVWCCDVSYQRWRFLHGEFPGTHPTHCGACGGELVWPVEDRVKRMTVRSRMERDRRIWQASQARRVARFIKAGKNSKGRKYERRPSISQVERAWREHRASMNICVPELLSPAQRYE